MLPLPQGAIGLSERSRKVEWSKATHGCGLIPRIFFGVKIIVFVHFESYFNVAARNGAKSIPGSQKIQKQKGVGEWAAKVAGNPNLRVMRNAGCRL